MSVHWKVAMLVDLIDLWWAQKLVQMLAQIMVEMKVHLMAEYLDHMKAALKVGLLEIWMAQMTAEMMAALKVEKMAG